MLDVHGDWEGCAAVNFYNDIDSKACAWTRALIDQGSIPPGDVTCKSILEVTSDEIKNYTQCHLFNGISGWPLAFRIAGWPADRPVWSASLPCQPFSAAGKGRGAADERNLWQPFFTLVKKCRPEFIVGEQVAQAIGFNWLDGISADLEAEGYIVGAIVLGAHSVGAPHKRQRLYWMAYDASQRLEGRWSLQKPAGRRELEAGGAVGGLGNSESNNERRERECREIIGRNGAVGGSGAGLFTLGDSNEQRPQGRGIHRNSSGELSAWSSSVVIQCGDGKSRRIPPKSGVQLLADGLSDPGVDAGWLQSDGTVFPICPKFKGRVDLLRGFGNAINPWVAKIFIETAMQCL